MGKRWQRKWDQDARTDGWSPIPTQVVSNEEYSPLARTAEQARSRRSSRRRRVSTPARWA